MDSLLNPRRTIAIGAHGLDAPAARGAPDQVPGQACALVRALPRSTPQRKRRNPDVRATNDVRSAQLLLSGAYRRDRGAKQSPGNVYGIAWVGA